MNDPAASNRIADRYYASIGREFPLAVGVRNVAAAVLDPDKPPFLQHLNPALVLAKRTLDYIALLQTLQAGWKVGAPTADQVRTGLLEMLERHCPGANVIIFDIGAKSADGLEAVIARYSGTIVAVVEDTLNGHVRWTELERQNRLPVPVISLAEDPLKQAEHARVGWSIVQCTEDALRADGLTLKGSPATVIGYGRIGSNVALLARELGAHVRVFDTHPTRATEAADRGFEVAGDLFSALRLAKVVLVATNGMAIRGEQVRAIPDGSYVGCATTPGELIDLVAVRRYFGRFELGGGGGRQVEYRSGRHAFLLMSEESAINWDRARVGHFIHLLGGGLAVAASVVGRSSLAPAVHTISAEHRAWVARTFGDHFYPGMADPSPEHFAALSFEECLAEARAGVHPPPSYRAQVRELLRGADAVYRPGGDLAL